MSISSEETIRKTVNGPISVGTDIVIGFSYGDEDHIKVFKTNTTTELDTNLILNTDFEVTVDGLNINLLLTGITSSETLTIYRETEIIQEQEYLQSGRFPSENTENALDHLTRIVAEKGDALVRSIQLPLNTTFSGQLYLDSAPEASAMIGWDYTGTKLENKDATSQDHQHTNMTFLESLAAGQYYTDDEVDALLATHHGASSTDHDDRYYTETEVDALLASISLTAGVECVKNLVGNQDTDTDHDINFARVNTNYNAEVLVRDSSYNVRAVTYAGEMTKQIDATWASGDDAGGLDDNDTLSSGQCLYGFLLCKSSDNSIDFGFTDDITGVSLLTDAAVVAAEFDEISVTPIHYLPPLDGSSNILDHATYEIEGGGLEVYLNSSINDVSTISTSYVAKTLTVPPDSFAKYTLFTTKNESTTITCRVDSTSEIVISYREDVGYEYTNLANGCIKVDSSNQVEMKSNVAVDTFKWYTLGYKVSRRPQ